MNRALKRAVDVAGGQAALARLLKTSQSQVWFWLNTSLNGTPAEFVIPIEQATGVSRHDLRPDIYPKG